MFSPPPTNTFPVVETSIKSILFELPPPMKLVAYAINLLHDPPTKT